MEFILNDRLIKTDKPGGMTLLDFVRYEKHLMGTKIGCREGDCGACTILIGELSQGEVRYLSMTSCIAPLANAEGKHIVTVEGLNLPALSPVQNAFVEAGGTQCGFCTVGFVVSLTGYCITATDPTFEDAISAIDGNICRCTGYKSIERAAENVVGQLRSIVPKKKLEWLVNNHFIPEYFLTIPARLSAISKSTTASSGPNHRAGFGIVGGGTDLYVQRPEDFTAVEVNPFFGRQDISGISSTTKTCTVGAASTVTDLLHSPVFNKLFPELRKHLKLISSTQIRNMGTIGGNLVNASPIGDMTIFFLALDSSLTLRMTTGESRNVLLRDFYKKYKTIDKGDDEFVEAISFETIGKGAHFN